MTRALQHQALLLLRRGLNNPTANFRSGQWEAITTLVKYFVNQQADQLSLLDSTQ